jgi:hypothetical protein
VIGVIFCPRNEKMALLGQSVKKLSKAFPRFFQKNALISDLSNTNPV